MKRILKKVPLRKKEADRTKKEKIIRDLAFFGVVAFASVMAGLTLSAEADLLEAEANVATIDYLIK